MTSYSDGYASYTLNSDNTITVKPSGRNVALQRKDVPFDYNQGYTPPVRYIAVGKDGKKSKPGILQPLITADNPTASFVTR